MDSRPDPGGRPTTLLIACGALAREIIDLIRLNGWTHMSVTCLPAIWHNRPEKIPEGVRRKIRDAIHHQDTKTPRIFIAFSWVHLCVLCASVVKSSCWSGA